MRWYSTSRNRKRGSIMVMFSLMLPTVIVPLVGLGIDAAILYNVQAKLSAATDGAALGAGRLLGTAADPAEIAREFLNANFNAGASGFWGSTFNGVPTITYTNGVVKTIQVTASVQVPLLFARIFGQSSTIVSATATATRRDSRVVLVIDRSGSMNTSDGNGSTVINDVVTYAQGFVGKFTPGTDELGLVVYDGSAVVGYPSVRPWDSTTTSTSTGGPDTNFANGSTTDMPHQIRAITASSGTGMAEALWIAYIELQKAHMRDLARDGVDNRLNSIVLFTDGVPTAISLYLNNPSDNMLKTTSACAYRTSTTQKMIGWWVIPGNPQWSIGSSSGQGIYLEAATDSNTAAWWMANGGADQSSIVGTTPFNGCNGLSGSDKTYGNYINSPAKTDFNNIPSTDRWGDNLTGNGYTNSHIVDSGGNVSYVYRSGYALDRTQMVDDYHWSLAIWNSVDSAAQRIRADANRTNRPSDLQGMQVAIYAIGYLGNGGTDDGLLKRVANDKSSTSYDAAQATGIYIPASDQNALANAFNTIASIILRLSQ